MKSENGYDPSPYQDWADTKYRPKSFPEIKGNKWAMKKLRRYADNFNFPHLLFAGPPGVGKSCAAEILAKAVNAEFCEWNASDKRRISDIRNEVKPFAMTKSITRIFKVAFMDECENLWRDSQPALRRIMEDYSENCKFILATNELPAIIEPIKSRCSLIRFNPIHPDEIFNRLGEIVKAEFLEEIITEDQASKIAESSGGDMRLAVKTLQSLCEGRKEPLTDEEIKMSVFSVPIKQVDLMLKLALRGNFTEAAEKFHEISYIHSSAEIYEAIEKQLIYSPYSNREKIRIANALSRVRLLVGEKEKYNIMMYSFLGYLGGGE